MLYIFSRLLRIIANVHMSSYLFLVLYALVVDLLPMSATLYIFVLGLLEISRDNKILKLLIYQNSRGSAENPLARGCHTHAVG